MADTGDRMDRAGRYVLGLMDDEERKRAERDLETDPALREAMVEIAGRMHAFDRATASEHTPQDLWRSIKERIDAMPQMQRSEDVWRGAAVGAEKPQPPLEKPVTFGRRKSDTVKMQIDPSPALGVDRIGPHSMPGRRAVVLALCLAAAFALGYATGVSSGNGSGSVEALP